MWKHDMAMQAAHEEQLRTMEMSLLGELWPDDSISLKNGYQQSLRGEKSIILVHFMYCLYKSVQKLLRCFSLYYLLTSPLGTRLLLWL